MDLAQKKRIQISFTQEQIKKLSWEAAKKGLTKSSFLAIIFEEWLVEQENKQRG